MTISESHACSPGANGAMAPVSLAVQHVMTDNPNLKTLIPRHADDESSLRPGLRVEQVI